MKDLRLKIWMILFISTLTNIPLTGQSRASSTSQSFLTSQLQFSRVREAQKNQGASIDKLLKDKNIDKTTLQINIRAFKTEGILELWAKSKLQAEFVLLKEYEICAKSGSLGPKLKQGDGQVPEGIYHIDRFNPTSLYHLSLGISYPNSVDKVRSKGLNPGGDIFIHGQCLTIGCLPMTDEIIEQIYLMAVHAKNNGQKQIKVSIFPFKMTEANLQIALNTELGKKHMVFWKDLAKHYNNQ